MLNIIILKLIKIKKILYNIFEYSLNKIENKNNIITNNGETLISLLILIFLSGIYLFFFYSIYIPYESILEIQYKIKLGNIVRNIHNNCSIVCFFICIVHTIKMVDNIKFSKSSKISWLSGFFLFFFLLICIESGIILINDKNSQVVLIIFAKLIEKIKIFKNTILRIFSGEELLDNSFFFIILFLHIFITLFILITTCLHTIKIKFMVFKTLLKNVFKLFIYFFLISLIFEQFINEKNTIINLSDIINNINLINYLLILINESEYFVIFFLFFILLSLPVFIKLIFYIINNLNYNNKIFNKDYKKCIKCMKCLSFCNSDSIEIKKKNIYIKEDCESCSICFNICHIKTIKDNKINKIEKYKKKNKNFFLLCDKKKKYCKFFYIIKKKK